jgi:hypothetical protein
LFILFTDNIEGACDGLKDVLRCNLLGFLQGDCSGDSSLDIKINDGIFKLSDHNYQAK